MLATRQNKPEVEHERFDVAWKQEATAAGWGDRDITIRGVAGRRTADSRVEHVMSRDVATIGLHVDVSDAAAVMAKHVVRRLPVVDEENRPHGTVTFDDLVRHLGSETDALADLVILQATQLAGT